MKPLAIFHSHTQIISRGKGKSAVAAAAYRAGELIQNEYDGVTHDYTRKGGVVHTEIVLPAHAPVEYSDRAVLWNAVEKIERAKNSQLAREIDIALPIELTREQNISLIREYVERTFVSAGMCADLCVHDTGKGNPHVHIMLTMRPIDESRKWGSKQRKEYIFDRNGNKIYDPQKRQYKCRSIPSTDWNNQAKADEWRTAWEDMVNAELKRHGFDVRIDRRSYEEQGIEKIPTVHMGVAATQMERKEIRTERGDLNREIEVTNKKLRQLKARISKLQTWLKEETENTEQPTLADMIQNILSRREQEEEPSRYERIGNLKAASNMLNFLTENKIVDMEGLGAHLQSMRDKQLGIRDKLKPIDRRLKTLDEHIKQAEIYLKHKKIYKMYKQEKPKGQEAFFEQFRMELTLYQAADRYLSDVMNGRTTLPIKAWRAERDGLTAERKELDREYRLLKGETAEVEKIRRNVQEVMRVGRERQSQKGRVMEK